MCIFFVARTMLGSLLFLSFVFFSSRRRHTRLVSDWSSDVCSSDLMKLKNNNLIFLTAFINGIHTYMMRVLIQPFVLSITSSMTMVGLVDGLTHSLVPSLIQLPSGFVSDRVGRKTPIIVASILIIFSFLVFLSAYFTGSIALVILGAVLFG